MEVKIKRVHPNAVIPKYSKPGDAGMDLVATGLQIKNDIITYHTGLQVEIPEGYVGLIVPRSSIYKQDLMLANHIGIIDSGYRGEILCKFRLTTLCMEHVSNNRFLIRDYEIDPETGAYKNINTYKIGDRVAQLIIIPYPLIEFKEVDVLKESNRGTGGFGHTGN